MDVWYREGPGPPARQATSLLQFGVARLDALKTGISTSSIAWSSTRFFGILYFPPLSSCLPKSFLLTANLTWSRHTLLPPRRKFQRPYSRPCRRRRCRRSGGDRGCERYRTGTACRSCCRQCSASHRRDHTCTCHRGDYVC